MAVIKSGSTTDQAFVTPANALKVDGSAVTQPVSISGTVPVSAASLPLPSGAAQDGTDGATPPVIPGTGIRGWLRSIYDKLSGSLAVTGTFFQATQPISAASLPLPTGAAQDGTDGASAPIIPGTGIRGWLRSIYDRLSAVLTFQDRDAQTLLGVYYYHGGANLVLAAADAATAGRFWVINPIGSGITLRIKSIEFASQLGSALAAPTSPRLTIERVTFTGTASGAALTPAKRKSTDANPKSSLVTASTGLALTAGAIVVSFLPVASATAVGYTNTAVEKWKPEVDDRIDLLPGEGIVCRQPDAGTTSDTRRYTVDVTAEEF